MIIHSGEGGGGTSAAAASVCRCCWGSQPVAPLPLLLLMEVAARTGVSGQQMSTLHSLITTITSIIS